MKISIISCGWYGLPLAESLVAQGHDVLGSTRSEEKKLTLQSLGINPHLLEYPALPSEELLSSDIIILNIPPFKEQLEWFKSWSWNLKSKVIFISSTSVYSGAGSLNESSETSGNLAEIENWIKNHFSSFVIFRFGGLIGGNRHPGKVLSGRKDLKGGHSPVNLIHLDDCVGFTKTIIDQNIQNEIFNVVSDEHSSRKDFYTEFCVRKNLEKPEFDEADLSQGKLILNSKMSALYQLKFSRMIGKEL